MRDRLPTITFLTIRRPNLDAHCPRCYYLETTIHILRDCPWAREVWSQSPGILPLSFFHQTLQEWLQHNATTVNIVLPISYLGRFIFLFFVGIYGYCEMIGSLIINPDPRTALFTPLCRWQVNFTF